MIYPNLIIYGSYNRDLSESQKSLLDLSHMTAFYSGFFLH